MSLSQQGQQTVLTSSKPHLVGLDIDPLSTDIVIYHLQVLTNSVLHCFWNFGIRVIEGKGGSGREKVLSEGVWVVALLNPLPLLGVKRSDLNDKITCLWQLRGYKGILSHWIFRLCFLVWYTVFASQ